MKKNMSQKALTANRQNATKSTGPISAAGKLAVGSNALKHGLLAKTLRFRNEEEQSAFEGLLSKLVQELKPQDVVQCVLIEEIAVCLWKLASVADLEVRELSIRNRTTKLILQAFAEQSEEELPLAGQGTENRLLGLECRELLLRMVLAQNEDEMVSDDEKGEEKRKRIQVEARLGTSLDTTLRYKAGLKRDLYRAIDKLESLQRSQKPGPS